MRKLKTRIERNEFDNALVGDVFETRDKAREENAKAEKISGNSYFEV